MAERNLIIDVGVSDGADTAFYLSKGFDVVGIEADPIAVEQLTARFSIEMEDGRLRLAHRAASGAGGNTVSFWRNDTYQGLSSLRRDGQASEGGAQTSFEVTTIAWPEIVASYGVPHYLKIDIEGAETPFIDSMAGNGDRPDYVSAECHTFGPVAALYALGYRRFKLINQTLIHTFPIPDPPLEGRSAATPDWMHGSGPFGAELPGEWLDFRGFMKLYEAVDFLRPHTNVQLTWFDCHAAL